MLTQIFDRQTRNPVPVVSVTQITDKTCCSVRNVLYSYILLQNRLKTRHATSPWENYDIGRYLYSIGDIANNVQKLSLSE